LWLRVLEEVDGYVSEKLAAVFFNVDVWKRSVVMLISIYTPTGCMSPEDLI
jgi:hypothetical protein